MAQASNGRQSENSKTATDRQVSDHPCKPDRTAYRYSNRIPDDPEDRTRLFNVNVQFGLSLDLEFKAGVDGFEIFL